MEKETPTKRIRPYPIKTINIPVEIRDGQTDTNTDTKTNTVTQIAKKGNAQTAPIAGIATERRLLSIYKPQLLI